MTLSPARLATLEALCRRMVPLPDAPDPAAAALARAAWERINGVDADQARVVGVLLDLLGGPAAALLTGGPARRFAALPGEVQDRVLRGWEESAVGPRRTTFQALRRLILSTHYGSPSTYAELGYLGPFHTRGPAFPWEGPLPGAPSGEEPVARTASPLPTVFPAAPDVLRPEGIRPGTIFHTDVCVVGTGSGGAVAAARLAEAGHQVLMLEEGSWFRHRDMAELEPGGARMYAGQATRATDDLAVPILQGRCVGGGSTVNWLIMLRTPEWVLDEWARGHGTVGMGAADLDPVFRRIEEETHTRTVPDDAHSPINRALLDGARALGWSVRAASVNTRGCVRSGFCGQGCRYGARQGATAVYLPRAQAAGATLYPDARADAVEVVERGGSAPLKRVHVTLLDPATGRPRGRATVEAPIVVLAGGAVGTPSLLQRSGLGGGGVGKWLRLHPTTAVFARYGRGMYQGGGIPLSAVCDEHLRGPGGYGTWIEAPPYYPALASAALPGFGERHRSLMTAYDELAAFIVLTRDGAGGASQGEVGVDRRGRTRIRYRVGPAERARLLEGIQAAARIHFAAGAREVVTLHARECRMRSPDELGEVLRRPSGPNQLGVLSAHVNGTCRIGADRRTSGCTPDGQRHGVPGLYVADGSLLPTAPGANPQETIMALATVVAERISARHPAGRAGSAGALAAAW